MTRKYNSRRCTRFFIFVPVVFLIPFLFINLPSWHIGVENAGYFQSLAFIRTGFASYTFFTPDESFSSLHLHSVIASPLVGLGYTEGGRFISFLSAVASIWLIGSIGERLGGSELKIVSSALLWFHPIFILFAYSYMPEALGIALTLGAVALMLRYISERDSKYLGASLVLLVLGIANHMWEVTIVIPLAILLIYNREWAKAIVTVSFAFVTVALVWFVTHIQPIGGSRLLVYSIMNHKWIIFSSDWWLRYWKVTSPIRMDVELLLLTSTIMVIGCLWWVWRERSQSSVLLTSWLFSGLSIPFLMPEGYYYHEYYIWALLAPTALIGGLIIQSMVKNIIRYKLSLDPQKIINSIGVIVIFLTVSYILILFFVVYDGDTLQTTEEVEAGRRIQSMGVTSASNIVFIGKYWGKEGIEQETVNIPYQNAPNISQTLIYSGVLVKERSFDTTNAVGPKLRLEAECLDRGEILVQKMSNNKVLVTRCFG